MPLFGKRDSVSEELAQQIVATAKKIEDMAPGLVGYVLDEAMWQFAIRIPVRKAEDQWQQMMAPYDGESRKASKSIQHAFTSHLKTRLRYGDYYIARVLARELLDAGMDREFVLNNFSAMHGELRAEIGPHLGKGFDAFVENLAFMPLEKCEESCEAFGPIIRKPDFVKQLRLAATLAGDSRPNHGFGL